MHHIRVQCFFPESLCCPLQVAGTLPFVSAQKQATHEATEVAAYRRIAEEVEVMERVYGQYEVRHAPRVLAQVVYLTPRSFAEESK